MAVTLLKADVLLVAAELAAVPDSTWDVYLDLAMRFVDGGDWEDEEAEMDAARFLAAHLLTAGGLGLAAGGREIQSQAVGQVSVTYATGAAEAASAGNLQSTPYGRIYATLAAAACAHLAVT